MSEKIDLSQMPVVTDAASAGQFIRWCCRAIGPGFHPDTPFTDYVVAGGGRTFSDEEAAHLDAQITAAFGFIPEPYSIGLEEFEAMRSGPPQAEAGPVEGATMQVKVLLARRTDLRDPILSGFTAARMQLHLREARAMPRLAVVHVPAGGDPHLDRFAISGDHGRVLDWLRELARIGVAEFRYEVELPPAAREEGDEDAWADRLADRLDEPGINFSVHVCTDLAEWQIGLPPVG